MLHIVHNTHTCIHTCPPVSDRQDPQRRILGFGIQMIDSLIDSICFHFSTLLQPIKGKIHGRVQSNPSLHGLERVGKQSIDVFPFIWRPQFWKQSRAYSQKTMIWRFLYGQSLFKWIIKSSTIHITPSSQRKGRMQRQADKQTGGRLVAVRRLEVFACRRKNQQPRSDLVNNKRLQLKVADVSK